MLAQNLITPKPLSNLIADSIWLEFLKTPQCDKIQNTFFFYFLFILYICVIMFAFDEDLPFYFIHRNNPMIIIHLYLKEWSFDPGLLL